MNELSDLLIDFHHAAVAAKVDRGALLERLVVRADGIHIPPRAPRPTTGPPSGTEEASGSFATEAPFSRRPVLTVSLTEASATLKLEERLVSILLDTGALQGVDIEGRLHIPEWQFDASSPNGLVPCLGMILTAAEGRLNWVELAFFMLTAQPPLIAEGALTLVEWLHFTLPITRVLDIARSARDLD